MSLPPRQGARLLELADVTFFYELLTATLPQGSLQKPFFQGHMLTSRPCVTGRYFLQYFQLFHYYYTCYCDLGLDSWDAQMAFPPKCFFIKACVLLFETTRRCTLRGPQHRVNVTFMPTEKPGSSSDVHQSYTHYRNTRHRDTRTVNHLIPTHVPAVSPRRACDPWKAVRVTVTTVL